MASRRWGSDDGVLFWEGGWPTHEICPCCSNEADVADTSLLGVRGYRGYWVGQGTPWGQPSARPADWDLLTQIANIPAAWH
ncbi:hypothetical protein [Streptomyces coeruleorubidus]|uniref:hypothetical protein n=1 Tax=Streptomyces coeruleorubidus TaxID=116188 RepID=UPI00339DE690